MKKRTHSGAGASAAHLLDTSTLLWALGSPERLSPRVKRLIDGGENIVSVASYWEVVIKTQKGLLSIADVATWWRRATEIMAVRALPIRATHVTALAALPMLHKDPFDRILIAQAIAEGLVFVTNDEHISAYPVRTIW
jgi:PIN domain nuclease of toxin-antitoxin system